MGSTTVKNHAIKGHALLVLKQQFIHASVVVLLHSVHVQNWTLDVNRAVVANYPVRSTTVTRVVIQDPVVNALWLEREAAHVGKFSTRASLAIM